MQTPYTSAPKAAIRGRSERLVAQAQHVALYGAMALIAALSLGTWSVHPF